MKKLLTLLLALTLCLPVLPGAMAAGGARDLSAETALAQQLQSLGLFQGVGTEEDGSTDFALDRAPSRVEAATMLVRTLGKGTEAEALPRTHPFTDVPAWADGYVSYAYDQGLTRGVSDTAFGAEDPVTAGMYLTFLLRALGYTEGPEGDFTWDAPWILAESVGMLPEEVDRENFLRADVVTVTCAALFTPQKETADTLAQVLISQGVFTQREFIDAFPADPFPDPSPVYDGQEQAAYNAAVAACTGTASTTVIQRLEATDCTVLYTSTAGGAQGPLPRLLLVYKPGSAQGAGKTVELPLPLAAAATPAAPGDLALDVFQGTLTYVCRFTGRLLDQDGVTVLREAGTYRYTTNLSTGETALEFLPAGQAAAGEQAAYDAAVSALTGTANTTVVQRLEASDCVVLYTSTTGLPHGPLPRLSLVYKPGSAQGAGKTVALPLPPSSAMTTAAPEDLALSIADRALTYVCRFDSQLLGLDGTTVLHEAGTYRYTTDLSTGETVLEIFPAE